MTGITTTTPVGFDAVVDLNSARAEELARLPRIGRGAAALIVHERESRGTFASVWDLTRVEGFDWWRIGAFADWVRV